MLRPPDIRVTVTLLSRELGHLRCAPCYSCKCNGKLGPPSYMWWNMEYERATSVILSSFGGQNHSKQCKQGSSYRFSFRVV